ncbi:chitinase [Fomes fomentarius]|nr:chitinase [Fomes fomentarius]
MKRIYPIATAWYAGWHADQGFPLEAVPWSKYTHLTYAFAETTPDVHTLSLEGSKPELLPTFVQTAHKHGVKALVSVGGWTGSRFFSTAVADAKNRTAFVQTIVKFALRYDLDGIDFDWEYPGTQGIGCNTIVPEDTTNFLLFLQQLRAHPIGRTLTLTAATSVFPWVGADGEWLSDVSGFAKVFDWIAIMNYDLWGPWSETVGPNAALDDSCAAEENQQGSAASGIAQWTAAGFPANKILLGVPAYGHSFYVNNSVALSANGTLNLYTPFEADEQPAGDAWDDAAGVDVCGNETGTGGSITFWGLIENGFLNKNGTAASGIKYIYDTCSQTPFVYNTTSSVLVSFDDPLSFAAKGAFIKEQKLRGFAMWESGGDSDNLLLNAIRRGAGIA